MTFTRNHLAGAAAVAILGLGLGFLIARIVDPHENAGAPPAATHEDDHAVLDAVHPEGFVELDPADAPAAGVQLAHVEQGGGADLIMPGRVSPAANAQSSVEAPLDGSLIELRVAAGSRIVRGSPIALMRSPDGAAAFADLDSATAALELAEAIDRRDSFLFEQGAISKQQHETTRAATRKAQADRRSAEAMLQAMGSPDATGIVIVRSPIAGIVTRIETSPGAVLDDGDPIADITDTSQTELVFDAPPAAVAGIVVGLHIEGRGASGELIEGEVTGIGAGIAGGGATVRARIIGAGPPSGTVISGRLARGGSGALTVPSDAVQTLEGRAVVFIAEARGFRVRPVITGRTSSGYVEIISGLSGDERIAGAGSFLLKAELGKADAEHDH